MDTIVDQDKYDLCGLQIRFDEHALNEARWAACDVRFSEELPQGSMEYNTAVADIAIKTYLEKLILEYVAE